MRFAVFVVLSLLFHHSFAQDDAVVVTGARLPEEVRNLPASVSVITRGDIERSAARTLPELVSGEVGFTTKDFYGNNAASTSLDLRGFGVTGPQNTLILLDGKRVSDFDLSGVHWAAIPLASIERVEIVRGSGAVLYGDGAASGVVNIVTRSPLTPGRRFEVLGRAASYETFEAQLYGAYGTSTFGLNGSVYGYGSDGYRANNRNEQQNNTLNLRWALKQSTVDVRLGTDRQDLRLPGGRFVQPSIGLDEYAADRRGASTPLDYASRDGERAGASFTQRIGEAEASVALDARDKDTRSFFDQSGFPTFRADRLRLYTLSPRVRMPFGNHRLIAGFDSNEWRYRSRRTDRPENLAQPTNRVSVRQQTRAFYVQDTLELAPGRLVSGGWRSERARYTADDTVDPAAPPCANPFTTCVAAAPIAETQKARAWELGVRQALAAGWTASLRAGRSFRFVNAEEIYENDIFFAPQFQLLRPQRTRTHEGGLEWSARGHRARATLFRTDVFDEIHLDPFTTGVGNTNLPPSRRQGVELDGRWQAAKALSFTAAYAYTDAKFLEGTLQGSPFAIGTNLPLAGKTVPLVPRHKLNLGAAWDLAPGTRLSGALTAVSEQVMDNDEPNTLGRRIPAYYVADLKLARTYGWGRVAATINNLFDQKYYNYAVRSAFTPDRYSVYPLAERSFSLALELLL